jgi:protein-S-isoprenylcysteine O-methyltransferase Ste14
MLVLPSIRKLRVPLSRLIAIPLGLLLLCSRSTWEEVPPLSALLFASALVLVAIGSLGRLWCALYIAGQKTKTLVSLGPYSISRNPLYFFSLLGGIGVGFGTETLLIPMGIALLFGIYYPYVIKREEVKLLAAHGETFRRYCKRTPRFIPDYSRLEEPEEYTVNPTAFKREVFSALWFIWLLGLFELIEELHDMHLLPIFFKIY